MRPLNSDFRVSNKSDHICNSHFRDNSITMRPFGVCAIVVPGCKLHFCDEQFAAGGKEIQVLAAEILCSVERCHALKDEEAMICQERGISSRIGFKF